jgi:putative transposase
MFKNVQSNSASGSDKKAAAPKGALVFAVKDTSEVVKKSRGRLAFQLSDGIGKADGRRGIENKMQMVSLAVGLDDFALDFRGGLVQNPNHKVSLQSIEYMATKLNTPDDVVGKPIATMACCFKTLISDDLAHGLKEIETRCRSIVNRMLANRSETSSKFYKEIPCVIAKSLSSKYQRNLKCKSVKRIVIPVCGDKGKQIKIVEGGVRIPALFKKSVLPVYFPRKISGHVRNVEIYQRGGRWFANFCVNVAVDLPVKVSGVIGVDRNSVGNIAVMADLQTGHVRHMGFNPARTKSCWRGRKKNLQRQGKRRLLSKLRKNHARRSQYQNHVVSKTVVEYAKKHSRAIALEKLSRVTAKDSKIRKYSQSNQWAFAQLASFIQYKARLAGVTVVEVDPAYSSQTCSHCGHIHKPNGKLFSCPACGHEDHRDSNAAFVIGKRGLECISGLATHTARSRSALIDSAASGTLEATKI